MADRMQAAYTAAAVTVRNWVDEHNVSLLGATPSMLSGIALNAALPHLCGGRKLSSGVILAFLDAARIARGEPRG